MGVSGLKIACFGVKECSHSFALILAKLDMDNGQLLAKDERYAKWFKNYDPNSKRAQNELQNWQSCFSWLLK